MLEVINQKVCQYFDEVVNIRRKLHQHPELSFCEKDTAELIKHYLDAKHIEYQSDIAGYGIVATIKGQMIFRHYSSSVSGDSSTSLGMTEGMANGMTEGMTVALRADMDALPIQEQNDVLYRSLNNGVMHACGHDAHTAMLLGVAFILNEMRDKFSGIVKLIFQPGEEKLPGGASLMIKEGVLDDVDMIIGQHVYPDLACGEVGFHPGPYMASSDEVNITVKGRGGHAAKPAERDYTVLAAAKIVSKLAELYPEKDINNVKANGLLAFGSMIGDGTYNVMPAEVNLKGTMRTFDEDKRKLLKDNIIGLSKEISSEYGCDADVFIEQGYPSLQNDVNLTKKCIAKAKEFLGDSKVKEIPRLMTAEDFAWYSQKIPACFYRLGVSNHSKGIDNKQHTSTFDIDEESMKTGMGMMVYLAINSLS